MTYTTADYSDRAVMPSLHLFDDGFCGSRSLFNHAIDFLSCHGLKFVINRYSFTMNQLTNGYELPGAHQDGLLELLTPEKPLSIMERLKHYNQSRIFLV